MRPRFNGWKMDPEQRRVWVEALRSGKYEQTGGQLFNGENAYCCLGVKCMLDGNLIDAQDFGRYVDKTIQVAEINWNSAYINIEVIPHDVQDALAGYNDNGKSFKWIAAYIDRYL